MLVGMRTVRRLQVAALVVCLVCLPHRSAVAEAAPTSSEEAAKAPKNAKRRTTSVRKSKTKRKLARRRRARKRRAARKRTARARKTRRKKRANRPSGWQWPPTEAMREQGKVCLKTLTELGVSWKRARHRKGVTTPIVVPSLTFNEVVLAPTFRKPPFVMDCHLAVALTKAAPQIEAAGVSELRFSSIYSYRKVKVGGIEKNTLSRHSYGLAVDVYQVRDDKGEVFVVEDDYRDDAVIQKLEDVLNQTGLFRLVLSPANDPKSHSDHLHLEARVAKLRKERVSKRRRRKRLARKRRAQRKSRKP